MASQGSRPPASSPKFRAYLEAVIKSSKTRLEAARKLGYSDTKSVWYHMKKLDIEAPSEWHLRPELRSYMRQLVPEIIIPTFQGEGSIRSNYVKLTDSTVLDLMTGMTDPAPIFKLSEYFGLPRPTRPKPNHEWKPVWFKGIYGLRAYRVLREIRPFLLGDELKEADRALEFFSPYGHHPGYFRSVDVWPPDEFPLRKRRLAKVEFPC